MDEPTYGSAVMFECGDDAAKWAAAFCKIAAQQGHEGIDEGWIMGWFAAAIEHSNDVRRWRRKEAKRLRAMEVEL